MSDTTKKVLLSVFIVILVAGIAFGVYWAVKNYDKVEQGLSGSNLYTAEDLENAKKEGYEEGISSLKILESQIENLKSKIDEYKVLLDAYSKYDDQTYFVNFYNKDGLILESFIFDKNSVFDEVLIPIAPELENFKFLGYSTSLDSKEIVSFSDLVVDKNMKFYAVYEECFNVKLVYDEMNSSSYSVIKNDLFTLPVEVDSYNGYLFKGWVLVEDNNFPVSSYNSSLYLNNELNITKNLTFVAVYGLPGGVYADYFDTGDVYMKVEVEDVYFSVFSSFKGVVKVSGYWVENESLIFNYCSEEVFVGRWSDNNNLNRMSIRFENNEYLFMVESSSSIHKTVLDKVSG